MPIPDHVRKEAMNAVNHKETTAQIRAFNDSGVSASPSFNEVNLEYAKSKDQPLTDEVRKQAMNSISHNETTAQIRLVKDSGSVTPDHTPSRKTDMIAERIAEMHKSGHSVGAIQQTMTKDNFGREHEIG
jgi:hypothetical protein